MWLHSRWGLEQELDFKTAQSDSETLINKKTEIVESGLYSSPDWDRSLDSSTTTYTHTRLTALFPGQPGWAGTRKVKPSWILLKQETVSGSDISWAICKSASRSRQITMPVPHHSFFTGRMPFLPPNQQRQSTEGKWTRVLQVCWKHTAGTHNVLFDVLADDAATSNLYFYWLGEYATSERLHLARECCWEHDSLPIGAHVVHHPHHLQHTQTRDERFTKENDSIWHNSVPETIRFDAAKCPESPLACQTISLHGC